LREGFLDRLAGLLKSILGENPSSGDRGGGSEFSDPDVSDAWEELDAYMRTGHTSESSGREGYREQRSGPGAMDEELRQDYANLEVPFGASLEDVKTAYKRLVLRYHPDKHASDPERLRIATEITKKINESFERLRTRAERRGRR
jgi:DnaJ-domain-containing protein 1